MKVAIIHVHIPHDEEFELYLACAKLAFPNLREAIERDSISFGIVDESGPKLYLDSTEERFVITSWEKIEAHLESLARARFPEVSGLERSDVFYSDDGIELVFSEPVDVVKPKGWEG